ncbi:MAG: MobF family relaxase [Pseudomonadota bacterium]
MTASISAVSSAAAAADYYGKDNYYARGVDDPEPSSWTGRGAKALGLSGKVDIETFEKVLSGETLDGRRVGQRENETAEQAAERAHRPGADLTFSPPKDVSLLLYLGGDKRILAAHRAAVNSTLKWAENHLAGTRIRRGKGQPVPVKTGNLVMAKFEHDISRDMDPQLHTHCVIANMTQDGDGKWRALHNDPLFRHAKLLGLAYDAEMREGLRKLGYVPVLQDGKTGKYSIDGVPDAAKEEFSRRSNVIKAVSETLENNTPKARKAVSLKTRPSKRDVSQDERQADWETRGAEWKAELAATADAAKERVELGRTDRALGDDRPDSDSLLSTAKRMAQNFFRPTRVLRLARNDPYAMDRGGSEREYASRAAVSFGLRHHEEREAAFSLHTARRSALEHGADGVTLKTIDHELRRLRRSGQVKVSARDPDAESTTARSIAHERVTKSLVAAAGKTQPLVGRLALNDRLSGTQLTKGQRQAVETVLAGENRLVGIQGYAGTGKTTMMRQTAELARDLAPEAVKGGYKLMGLAPTHSARGTLEESAGFKTQTVQRFLIDQKKGDGPKSLSDTIMLVDESSFLSTKSMNRVLETLIRLDPARIVLSGDRRQHGAVEAGRPFDIAQKAGMTTAVMKDIVRLPKDRDHQDQRIAVTAAAHGNVTAAMKRLDANMMEVQKDPEKAVASVWRNLPRDRQGDVLIVAPGHRVRTAINNEIRRDLIGSGRLGQEATRVPVMQSRNLTAVEATSPRSYQLGDKLVFHARLNAVNAKKGVVREVIAIDEQRGRITLRNMKGGGQTISLDALKGDYESAPFSVNREEDLELRSGDKLLFTRSDADSGIAAMDHAKVARFDEGTVTLDVKGEEQTFGRDDPVLLSLTHGYAITSHASQGKTAQDVISVVDSKERMLTNQTGFYVSISRSADSLALIVDDKAKVMETLLRNSGMKSSALEALERIESFTGLDRETVADAATASGDKDKELELPLDVGANKTPDQQQGNESGETEQEQDLGLDRDFGM